MLKFLITVSCFLLVACQMPPTVSHSNLSPYQIDRAELPPDASEVLQALEQLIAQVIQSVEPKVAELKKDHIAQLQKLQEKYTKLGKLDEAVAIRDAVRQLSHERPLRNDILPDLGNLSQHRGSTGSVLYFDVVGSMEGSVWGTDIYTADSRLAAVAVHAGVLRIGMRGVVKVTILPSQSLYRGSMRHGVTSSDYNSYPGSYKVTKP